METIACGDKPKTLQTIAYISIPNSADLEFLLWDLQDAIAAYARLSGTSLPRLVALGTDDGGSVADGIVFAVENALNNEAMSVVEQALDCLGGTEARVYVVVQASCGSPERAHTVVGHLREACERRGGCRDAVALSPAPAPASQRFAAPHAWASCADRFPKRWISSWVRCVWVARLSMHSDSAAAVPRTSTPMAWFLPSQPCRRQSGKPL